jgi:carboxyl-terminal processing protease
VGDAKTHGKGTVQSLVPLDRRDPALGSLKITAAKFYRIAGGSTQLRGVTPDIVMSSALDALEIGEEHLPNALGWAAVDPAPYRPAIEPRQAIPLLRARSEARRADSPRFAAERELIERVAAMQRAKTISLNLQERVEMAREERRLGDAEKEVDEEGTGPKSIDSDLVLLETLQVLSDMIELQKPPERAP